jgi:hypothetical protein
MRNSHQVSSLFLLAAISLLIPASDPASAGEKQASFRHEETGLAVPPHLGYAHMLGFKNFEKDTPGAGYGIGFQLPGNDFVTLYIYKGDHEYVSCDVTCTEVMAEFKQSTSAMKTLEERGVYENVKKLEEGIRSLGDLQSSRDALYATYAHTMKGAELLSRTYLTSFEGHFVKLRFTYKKSSRKIAKKNIEEFLEKIDGLLTHHLLTRKGDRELSIAVKTDLGLEGRSKSASQAWLAHTLSRVAYVEDHRKEYPWIPGRLKPSFEEEVNARQASIQIWKEMGEKDRSLRDTYFDAMVRVLDTGFLREYVWSNHRRTYWKKPADLREGRFKNWAQKNLKDHRPETHGYLILHR